MNPKPKQQHAIIFSNMDSLNVGNIREYSMEYL
jgi:hypothetical protein